MHDLVTSNIQGGQTSKWHCKGQGCPHARTLLQRSVQIGGYVPHGSGGFFTALPHAQVRGALMYTRQSWQVPRWQKESHVCLPHFRAFPQTLVQRWSASCFCVAGQHVLLHLWTPQLFPFLQTRSQWKTSCSLYIFKHSTCCFWDPHTQTCSTGSKQSPHDPSWHFCRQ